VCPKSPFRAKEFLPGGVHYNPNPRELFRAPDRLNLGVEASLSHRYELRLGGATSSGGATETPTERTFGTHLRTKYRNVIHHVIPTHT
jgi:hypothetical protein